MRQLLNAGSGSGPAQRIARMMLNHGWEETRFDIDPNVKPDVIGSILELSGAFKPQSFDAVWTSHVLEHLYAHEVYPTLRQFHQILKPDGFALIMCPDVQSVAQFIVQHGSIGAIAYHSPAGPISPLDMLYGHSRAIEEGRVHMAHRTGFTAERLGNLLLMAGFPTVSVSTQNFEVCALALMPEADGEAIQRSLLESGFNFQEARS
ncbi:MULTISPECIES: class I SAM-dependent methyltransferase [Bradyrhizobium]|uniref:Class I SAM-dependent methyltransferase n=1 Tax=Bradyrhizobium frederickii TaxID=2560054 RepID=A0A4Y9KS08_9BRAD|nr:MULTISPECIES: class I SAM-dependent methyltransferase [Bradyrhizobium]RTE88012.1 class I SAM-dependent methyltransferase [Bradyrhizobium sp. LVM 105]TFV29564.1 class I SAM-dependent methyltransferase [Bradyrhizobium frederickii]TFV68018.1 class I SAM-dependent methyltransferase [Bradyrhizobium frederickii]